MFVCIYAYLYVYICIHIYSYEHVLTYNNKIYARFPWRVRVLELILPLHSTPIAPVSATFLPSDKFIYTYISVFMYIQLGLLFSLMD